VLEAIEYEVGRAESHDDLARVMARALGTPSRNPYTGKLEYPLPRPGDTLLTFDLPTWDPTTDPGGVARLDVFAAALEKRITSVPSLATSPIAEELLPRKRRRGRCTVTRTLPLGFDPLASIYCEFVTGFVSAFEYRVTSPTGDYANFDVMLGNTVYECKCGYLGTARDYRSSDPRRRALAERTLRDRIDEQMLRQRRVAEDCGLTIRYVVSNEEFASVLRERWGMHPVVDVHKWSECD
jgi:hypothetical protein